MPAACITALYPAWPQQRDPAERTPRGRCSDRKTLWGCGWLGSRAQPRGVDRNAGVLQRLLDPLLHSLAQLVQDVITTLAVLLSDLCQGFAGLQLLVDVAGAQPRHLAGGVDQDGAAVQRAARLLADLPGQVGSVDHGRRGFVKACQLRISVLLGQLATAHSLLQARGDRRASCLNDIAGALAVILGDLRH